MRKVGARSEEHGAWSKEREARESGVRGEEQRVRRRGAWSKGLRGDQ